MVFFHNREHLFAAFFADLWAVVDDAGYGGDGYAGQLGYFTNPERVKRSETLPSISPQ